MKRASIAVAGVLALALVGGGTAFALTSANQEPLSVEAPETSAPAPTEGSSTDATSAPEASAPATSTSDEDADYLATVDEKMREVTVLDQLTDAALIELGHEACAQIEAGTPIEDLRLVDGEQPNEYGYWLDTSTIFNSALLNYCTDLIEEVP